MKQVALKSLVFILALLSAVLLLSLCFFVSRNLVFTIPYLGLPIAVLIWSIIRYRRHRSVLFLTFGISFFVSALVLLFGLMVIAMLALRSFT